MESPTCFQSFCMTGEFLQRAPVFTERNGLSAYTSVLAGKGLEVSASFLTGISW